MVGDSFNDLAALKQADKSETPETAHVSCGTIGFPACLSSRFRKGLVPRKGLPQSMEVAARSVGRLLRRNARAQEHKTEFGHNDDFKEPLGNVWAPIWWEAPECSKIGTSPRSIKAQDILDSKPTLQLPGRRACDESTTIYIPISPRGYSVGVASPRDSEYGVADWQLQGDADELSFSLSPPESACQSPRLQEAESTYS